jgi:hypothetical protein
MTLRPSSRGPAVRWRDRGSNRAGTGGPETGARARPDAKSKGDADVAGSVFDYASRSRGSSEPLPTAWSSIAGGPPRLVRRVSRPNGKVSAVLRKGLVHDSSAHWNPGRGARVGIDWVARASLHRVGDRDRPGGSVRTWAGLGCLRRGPLESSSVVSCRGSLTSRPCRTSL